MDSAVESRTFNGKQIDITSCSSEQLITLWLSNPDLESSRFYKELRQFVWICLRRKQATQVGPSFFVSDGASIN